MITALKHGLPGLVLIVALSSCYTSSIKATLFVREGNRANNSGRYDEALRNYENFLTINPTLGLYRDYSQESEVCRRLAHVYSTQGRFTRAEEIMNRAFRIDSAQSPDRAGLIADYQAIGAVHSYKGDYKQAHKFLEKARGLCEKGEGSIKDLRRLTLAETLLSLSQLDMAMGKYDNARAYALQAKAIYDGIEGTERGIMETSLVLGIIAREKGQMPQAEEYLEQSIRLAESIGVTTSRQQQALSEVYVVMGQPEEAVRYKLNAIEQAERANIIPQQIIANMRLGDLYQKLGNQSRANYYYHQALRLREETGSNASLLLHPNSVSVQVLDHYEKSGSKLGVALVSLRLAEVYLDNNKTDSAFHFVTLASTLFREMESSQGMASAELVQSKIQFKAGAYRQSMYHARVARETSNQPDLQWQCYFQLARGAERLGMTDSARYYYTESIASIDKMRSNLTIEEFKTHFANTKVEVYDRLIQLLLTNKTRWRQSNPSVEVEALNLSEQARSRAFLDMLGNQRIAAKRVADSSLLNMEQELRLRMQKLTSEISLTHDAAVSLSLSRELNDVQLEYDALIHRIRINNPAYSSFVTVETANLPDIQKDLESTTAIIEYWVGEESTIAWVILKNRVTVRTLETHAETLTRLVRSCRNMIALQVAEQPEQMRQLHGLLIKPLLNDLRGIKNLVVVPHGPLHFLPFHALLSEQKKYLVEEYVISYTPSLSVYSYGQSGNAASGKDVLAMALGDVSIGNLSPLPGTEMEVNQLKMIYQDRKVRSEIESSCTESRFKEESPSYGYLHLATHGIFNPYQPMYSYLALYPTDIDDGLLTVNEIFELPLNCKVVTLSACETALGEIGKADELVGLSRAFLYAGASSVVVTLWKVDDISAAWLMTRFHQYIQQGKNAEESLSLAQRDMIRRNFQPSGLVRGSGTEEMNDKLRQRLLTSPGPFHWAAFMVIGRTR